MKWQVFALLKCEDVFTFDDQKVKSSQARGRLRCAFGVILAGPPARGRKVSQLHSSQSQLHALLFNTTRKTSGTPKGPNKAPTRTLLDGFGRKLPRGVEGLDLRPA